MKTTSLSCMERGWFVGKFYPSAYSHDNAEVAIKKYAEGDFESVHHHRIATEITVVISGKIKMQGLIFSKNDIIVIEPYEATDFLAIEDSILSVVKIPGVLNDKYDGEYID
jgi:hypothetical protein